MDLFTQLPKEIVQIFESFEMAGHKIYLVGGAVRDLLMGRRVSDWDFTTDAQPEQIIKLFPDSYYDNKFGTVGITSPFGILEVTTMRKEGDYTDFRHPTQVGWTDKIEEDLARRDFTINSMALGKPKTDDHSINSLIDPFQGQTDLKMGSIKAVGDPNKRFQEDALRMMRAIRIASELNFTIEPETIKAIKNNAPLITKISFERIRDELFKLLSSSSAYQGVLILKDTGLLELILPELTSSFGIVQEGPKHDRVYDIGEHSFLTLKYTPTTDPLVKLAALLHDIGKVETVEKDNEGNVTFYSHDVAGGRRILDIASRFHLSKKQTDKLYRLVRWHLFTVDENQTDAAIRRFIKNIGQENIDDMLALRVGDRLGGGTQKAVSWRMEKFKERIEQVLHKPFSITDLKINGNDVMEILNIPPGRKVGEILDQLFKEVLEDASRNNKEYLLKRLEELK